MGFPSPIEQLLEIANDSNAYEKHRLLNYC